VGQAARAGRQPEVGQGLAASSRCAAWHAAAWFGMTGDRVPAQQLHLPERLAGSWSAGARPSPNLDFKLCRPRCRAPASAAMPAHMRTACSSAGCTQAATARRWAGAGACSHGGVAAPPLLQQRHTTPGTSSLQPLTAARMPVSRLTYPCPRCCILAWPAALQGGGGLSPQRLLLRSRCASAPRANHDGGGR